MPILQNHTMTYNIILSFFTISSIWKCRFLNHTQPLYNITISSICFALLRYIIHVLVLAPAIFIFHSTCHTRWCTTPPNEGEASHCHVVFHHCCCSSVVAPALCHWKRYMHHRVSQWSFFQQYWNGLLMRCHWAVSLCVLWFHWKFGKLRRTRCQCCTYVVVHSNSGFVVRIFFFFFCCP